MDDPAATLESTGEPPPFIKKQPAFTAGKGAMKFSYPSGSKPLDGYTIKRGIGIGGFGEVYFALSDAGKEVALKKIQRNLDVELRGVRQCLNLKHVNLISLWDIRSNEFGESWVVMEYVPGPSLRDVVEANQSGMPEEQVKSWFISTASGVAYLHEHGIVHRDLKPGNIFCDEDEQVIKIGDYGLSKFISCSRRSGQTESVGTFHYMAPEIGKGVYGKEIDIYALGIILFEMLTGLVPFEGESSQEIIMKHLTSDPNVEIVPEGFRQVIAKSLRKDPELRYRSVPEMVADLPWPEIAANSQKIISQHAIGPMVPGSRSTRSVLLTADHPGVSSDDVAESDPPASAGLEKLPPVIISGDEIEVIPDIVFGPLTDNSQHPGGIVNQTSNHNAHRRRPVVAATRTGQTNEPVTIIDNQNVPATRLSAPTTLDINSENEPIARAVQFGFSNVTQWWNNANFSTPVKIILLVVAGAVVIQNSQWLLPLMLGLGLIYLMYYLGRMWISQASDRPKTPSPREVQRQKTKQIRKWLAARPSADRVTELVGSLLVGALACIVLNLLGFALASGVLGSGELDLSVESWANFTWLSLNSIVGCWALLTISKNWETKAGNPWLRRAGMIGTGLAIGAIAFYSAGSFNINLTELALEDYQARESNQFMIRGLPTLLAYLVFFAVLFGILRWWKQTDPLRKTRLSVLSVSLCLIWATVLSHVFNVPLTGCCILAVVVSVGVQLAAPWLHPNKREEICLQNSTNSPG